jgi:DNA-binding GntR family transcriptional regulator
VIARALPARSEPPDAPLAPLPDRVNRSEQAHQILRAAINAGQLLPGEIYSVQALAEQLGVSRTPVREALLQLARQGLVQPVRNRGFIVVETSLQDIRDIFEIRLLLEPAATRAAARRATPADLDRLHAEYQLMTHAARAADSERIWKHDRAFHRAIMEASGNTRLAQYIESLRDFVQTRGKLTTRSRLLVAIAAEHEPILAALERADGAAAQGAMRRHIVETRDALLAQEAKAPGPRGEVI